MKHFYLVGLGLTTVALLPLSSISLRSGFNPETLAGVAHQPKVQLQLAAEKQSVQTDPTGKEKVTWLALTDGKILVQPGDVIRYTISGANQGDRPASHLSVVQPIPKGTEYRLNSANGSSNGTAITYSIDNGKNFVANPTVTVVLPDGKVDRPAPATAYTNIRWTFSTLNPGGKAKAAYQVKVRS